jgi:uncharacterized protein
MSAATQKTQEPSMEDILASIRRIIADDQDAPKAPEPVDFDDTDEVLDLAEIEPETDSSADEMTFDEEEDFASDLQIVDLADSGEDEDDAEVELMSASAFDSFNPVEHEEDIEEDMEEEALSLSDYHEPPHAELPPEPPMAAFSPRKSQAEQILSSSADASVSQAFNMLANTVLSNNARTLEDLVREMMRPMLKVWLDDNLPSLVERMVRAEIERVARGR